MVLVGFDCPASREAWLPFVFSVGRDAKPGRNVFPLRRSLLPDGKGFEMSARVFSHPVVIDWLSF